MKDQYGAYRSFLDVVASPYISGLLAREIAQWLHHNGKEWTVSRLKNLRMWRLKTLDDPMFSMPYFSKKSTDSGIIPKGPFGLLWKLPLKKALEIFRVYTTFSNSELTHAQAKKFYGSLSHPKLTGDFCPRIPLGGRGSFNYPTIELPDFDFVKSMDRWTSSNRRAPIIRNSKPMSDVESNCTKKDHTSALFGFKENQRYSDLVKDQDPFSMADFFANLAKMAEESYNQGQVLRGTSSSWFDRSKIHDLPFHVGRISYIQEPGCKLRAIANPYRVWQALLDPLGKELYSLLPTIPEDCTFSQEDGIRKVQGWLQAGHTVSCVDMSDATNTFPREYTFQLLEQIFPGSIYIDIFRHICESPWLTPEGEYVHFNNGQPLGTYPSFAAFALSHHAFVQELGPEVEYVILGDDIALKGAVAGDRYMARLEEFNIPFSALKTMQSNKVAEFAGYVITPTELIPGLKWRGINKENFLDVAANLGPRSLSIFPPYLRWLVKQLSEVPEPYGLGWNPLGKPWEERIAPFLDDFLKPKVIPLPEEAGTHTLSSMEKAIFADSRSRGFNYTVDTDKRDPKSDQDFGPESGCLPSLAQLGFPIGKNLEARQEFYPVNTRISRSYKMSYFGECSVKIEPLSKYAKTILEFMRSGAYRDRPIPMSAIARQRVRRMHSSGKL